MASANAVERKRLVDLFSDLFILGAHLKTARDYGTPDALRMRLVEMFNAAEREAKRLAVPDDAVQQARFAVAAFLDEMILGVLLPIATLGRPGRCSMNSSEKTSPGWSSSTGSTAFANQSLPIVMS
ncbi:MAG: DotU family type IV/VI secretion system protein [Candidatus Manganitrophus sp.]|nr:MAG: DotU family type IV/VI secretion system protein [Candidatus Manganitrophus sp.]